MSTEKFNTQAQESISQIDLTAAQKRVDAILGPKGPAAVPDSQKPLRKQRSDKGVPKKALSDQGEIVLRVTVDVARSMATGLSETFPSMAAMIQDQIIQQLQKRLDSLSKQK